MQRSTINKRSKQYTLNLFEDLLELLNTNYKIYLKYQKKCELCIIKWSLNDSSKWHLCSICRSNTERVWRKVFGITEILKKNQKQTLNRIEKAIFPSSNPAAFICSPSFSCLPSSPSPSEGLECLLCQPQIKTNPNHINNTANT